MNSLDNEDIYNYPENYEDLEEYQKEAAFLLERIEERENFKRLLKTAKPEKFAGIRQVISGLDETIRETEEILDLLIKKHEKEKIYYADLRYLAENAEEIQKGFKEYFKANPEKLEMLDALLSEGDKIH